MKKQIIKRIADMKVSELPKIIMVKNKIADVSWNKHLPAPLRRDEKVIVQTDQKGVSKGYVRVKHNRGQSVSVFSISHFKNV